MVGSKRKCKGTDLSKPAVSVSLPTTGKEQQQQHAFCRRNLKLTITLPFAVVGLVLVVVYEIDFSVVQPYFKFPSFLQDTLSRTPARSHDTNGSGWDWVHFEEIPNETEWRLKQIKANGTSPCHQIRTEGCRITGLPFSEDGEPIRLLAGKIYTFLIISVGEDGTRRCAGGDFYETDLSGEHWRSRPPVMDKGDGSYEVSMQVDTRFAGSYVLKINLLYANFHGLHLLGVDDLSPWIRFDEQIDLPIEFIPPLLPPPDSPLPPPHHLDRCKVDDFNVRQWSGRWTRNHFNTSCEISSAGRYFCLPLETPCEEPWCEGPVGALESNGWVYSAHCKFKLFTQDEAWQCLDGKWLFWWGDSNHQDTLRNLLDFVLGCNVGPERPARRMDRWYLRPLSPTGEVPKPRQSVRMTNIFNGHADGIRNYQGLFSLTDARFAALSSSYFQKDRSPDVMIMNSGLHDGCYWKDPMAFVHQGLELATKFWKGVLDNILPKTPRFIHHTTIAAGGVSRGRGFNPHKMELFNTFFVEKVQQLKLRNMRIVDGYDLTFPWHFNNECNDGAHYGKAPANSSWVNGKFGHQYFVDLMLVHILLNAICDDV